MIGDRKVSAVICARGGSKGLPGKNIRPLCGRPMIAWSIEAARQSAFLDRILVSTDDPAIAQAARDAGIDVPFLRPAELATDDANLIDAILHALDTSGDTPHYVVLLQATSPLRTGADIDGCLRLCHEKVAHAAASVCEADKSPYWMFHLNEDGSVRPVIPREEVGFLRQALPTVWTANGAVYVAEVDWLRREGTFWRPGITLGYPMPRDRSVDIDSLLDFHLAELLLEAEG
jgi:CMP-N-acetylneuraminic acid synthetase